MDLKVYILQKNNTNEINYLPLFINILNKVIANILTSSSLVNDGSRSLGYNCLEGLDTSIDSALIVTVNKNLLMYLRWIRCM